jgi:DNA invertase Pin-like site-specific DNA recombinase
MNATAYVRVSSKAQNLATQRRAIEQEAAKRGDVVVDWYAEKKSAGTTERLELQRLRADIAAGRVKKVYGFRLDRFLRTGPADAFRFAEECHQAGVELVTVADGLHLKPGKDDVVTSVLLFAFSLAAKLERAAVNDRIAAARERLEAEGRPWGRPSSLTPKERERIAALAADGLSHRAIAQRTRIPRSTVTLSLAKGRAAA